MQGIFLALGSNLGERAGTLQRARQAILQAGILIKAESSIVETPALLPENAPDGWDIPFLNQVIQVETSLAPLQLLQCCKAIEVELGRQPAERWAPRMIDIDVLAYDAVECESDSLTLPHPHWRTRDFVLIPWAEIVPHWHWHGTTLSNAIGALPRIEATRYAA